MDSDSNRPKSIKKLLQGRFGRKFKASSNVPPSHFHHLCQEIALYFDENYSFWVRNLQGVDAGRIHNAFEQIKGRNLPKKNKARILIKELKK